MNKKNISLILKIIGIAGLVLLSIWIISPFRTVHQINVPTPLPIGSAFDGNEQIPIEEFKSKYKSGTDLLNSHKSKARIFRVLYDVTDWLSFGLTSIITLIVGYAGRVMTSQADSLSTAAELIKTEAGGDKSTDRNPTLNRTKRKVSVSVLGILAALASISIVLSNRFQAQAESNVQVAVELHSILSKSRTEWFNAKTPEEAQKALNELEIEILKHI
jgi:hypothetical protein